MAPRRTRYRIGVLRARAGVTRAELARAAGRSEKMIERYENGKMDPPAGVLVKIADALECGLDELIGRPTPPPEVRVNGELYERAVERAAESALRAAQAASDAADALRPDEPPGDPEANR